MNVSGLIERKRDGEALSADQWQALIGAHVKGDLPDYQMAALVMAVWFRGLTDEELMALTRAMRDSGDRLDLARLDRPRVDKHSTGGVGDKTSLILAPLAAAAGLAVPMISGRGLGHTGGTVDKLEAIPGFRTDLSLREAEAQLEQLGCVMIGQTGDIAPADKKLYALRDVTATIDSIPLIAASIMSKKLAEDVSGLVLDVKTGSGAFMPDLDRAITLAETMIQLGEQHECRTMALLTAMDRPLGWACGNALEVAECLRAMRGDGPAPADLLDVTLALGAAMLAVAGLEDDDDAARSRLRAALESGQAAETFARVIEAQGGDPRVVDDPGLLPQAPAQGTFESPSNGTIQVIEPRSIGRGVTALGGGRRQLTDTIDPRVGFIINVKPGEAVTRGQPLATVHARTEADVETGLQALGEAIRIGTPVAPLPLISHRITTRGVTPLAAEPSS